MRDRDAEEDGLIAVSRPDNDMEMARQGREIVDHMLGDGRSVIDPSTVIWTAEAAEDLRSRVEDNPIEGTSKDQWAKLEIQLKGAKRETVLLAAEMVFLREHPLLSVRPETRRSHIELVLALIGSPTIPDAMEHWLSRQSNTAGFEGGQGYYGGMWLHLIWMATFVIYWHSLSEHDRAAARQDPWTLQEAMLASGKDRSDIRNALQFLAWPEVFEPISSASMKKKIRNGFIDKDHASGDDPSSVDRDLATIRRDLVAELDEPFHFWSQGVEERWKPAPVATDPTEMDIPEPRPRHYWMYSPGRQASKWDEFSTEGIFAIGWDDLGDLSEYPDREAIRQALVAKDPSTSQRNDSLAVWEFQNEVCEGDIVYAKRGRKEIVGRGRVTSTARYEPDRSTYRHVRSVEWTQIGSWEHPGHAAMKTLTDVTYDRALIEQLEAIVVGDEDLAVEDFLTEDLPTYDADKFLDEVYLSEDRYQRLRSLLQRKKNVILAGPPGVGKTFTAKRLAYSIMGKKDPSRVEMIQFHQSYSYEDFMMGFRPTEDGGFALTEGPFYRFCEKARQDGPSRPYFFIIDEINRGNISKIFGELLMLIEADKREEQMRLLYKNEKFSVPPNVHLNGMMNTADRSLSVLDYALRRRFGFFEMPPGFDSRGFLGWQEKVDNPSFDNLVAAIVEVNEEIAKDSALGKGFVIGHSFLSSPRDTVSVEDWLCSVVNDELIPLLEEYWFDENDTAERCANKLRDAIA